MSKKARTLMALSDELTSEYLWRFLELKSLRQIINSTKTPSQSSVSIRSGITMLYAHFEGFLKKSGELYLQHISLQRLNNSLLKSSFLVNSIDFMIRQKGHNSVYGTRDLTQLIEFLFDHYEKRSQIQYKNAINTKSNLKFEVLENIFHDLHLPIENLVLKKAKIDELVRHRNSIAHGEYLQIDKEYYSEINTIILDVMNSIKDQIESSAFRKDYMETIRP